MSYKIELTDSFKKKAKKFLKSHPLMKNKYQKTLLILKENPFHPSLRTHKLQGKLGEYHSVSLDLSYRIVVEFLVTDKQIIPIDIGSHDDVY